MEGDGQGGVRPARAVTRYKTLEQKATKGSGSVANDNKGFTLWFTGLSGAGKTTIAENVGPELERRGVPVDHLDGGAVRAPLSKGLGFASGDRHTTLLPVCF